MALPDGFALGQNYPNPFNPSTIIPYQLPTSAHVRLEVFNLLGQRLATLVDAERSAGAHMAQWDGTDAAGRAVGAGVYIYRLSGVGVSVSRRMVLVDGQAGVPRAGATLGPVQSVVEEPAAAGLPVYGLTVSGVGLVPYVDPAFRVGVDEADIVLEEHDGSPRMKLVAGGILGDVDGNGQVDVFDALYVLLYSEDSSIMLPNNGDISLGDVNGDGRVDIADAVLLIRYSSDPSDPALPEGIGQTAPDLVPSANETSEDQETALSRIYWTGGDIPLQRANVDGSNIENLVSSTVAFPVGIALDVGEGKIYWADMGRGAGKIQRANLDGSNIETIVSELNNPVDIALDVEKGKVYWTEEGTGRIQRANLDGSNIETLITGLEARSTGDIALDGDGGKIYWTDWLRGRIQRANLDGSNIETLITGLDHPRSIALDGDKIYWTDVSSYKIQRANLDGSNIETLVVTEVGIPNGLALDVAGGKIYWTDVRSDLSFSNLQRANLDGSNIETLVSGVGMVAIPLRLALDGDEG